MAKLDGRLQSTSPIYPLLVGVTSAVFVLTVSTSALIMILLVMLGVSAWLLITVGHHRLRNLLVAIGQARCLTPFSIPSTSRSG